MAKQAILLFIKALIIGLVLNLTISYASGLSQFDRPDVIDSQTIDSTLGHTPSTTINVQTVD